MRAAPTSRSDKILVGAAVLSVALHLAALFGTPRFDLRWLYGEQPPAPIEVRLLRSPIVAAASESAVPQPEVKAQSTPKPKAKPTAEAKPQPDARPKLDAKPTPQAKPKAEAGPKAEAKPDAKPKPHATPTPQAKQPLAPALQAAPVMTSPEPAHAGPLVDIWDPPQSVQSAEPLETAAAPDVAVSMPGPPQAAASVESGEAGAPHEPPAEYPVRSARLVFDLYYGTSATKVGEVVHTWSLQDGHYVAETVAEAVGFISFFFGGKFVQRSEGVLASDGLVPLSYTLERGRRTDKPETARFDWGSHKLSLQWRDEHKQVDLPAGAQDPLSVLHQLYFLDPLPASAKLDIATSRKLSTQLYEVVGAEEIETPLGLIRTLRFRRQEPDGTLTEVWLDVDRNLLPAKLYSVDRKGNVLDQVIREARLE